MNPFPDCFSRFKFNKFIWNSCSWCVIMAIVISLACKGEITSRITFSNVIGVLLKNKKKTYAQYQMIKDIFYDCLCNMDLFEKDDFEKNVTYSRWCTGDRPIPKEILSFYDNAGFDGIQDNIQDDVIPNLINVPATRELLLELVADSVDVIGTEKADEFAGITDDAEFITALIRYAILNDHDLSLIHI